MTKLELMNTIKDLKDDAEITFYVWDYEYDNDNPYEIGTAKPTGLEITSYGNYFNLGVHK